MERELTIAEATESFAEVVAWAQQHGESVKVTEKGRVVAHIVPPRGTRCFKTGAEIIELWRDPNRPRLTPEEVDALEADIKAGHEILLPPKEDLWE